MTGPATPARLCAALVASIACLGADGPPARRDVAYGPHPHQRLDVEVPAAGAAPYPALVWFGNLWAPGKGRPPVDRFLPAGVACVAVEMRVMGDGVEAKVAPPGSVCLVDGRRAVQFVRLHAADWGLDPARIAVGGYSQGALPALYVGCAGELADPGSADPVDRASSRVACVAAIGSQPSVDPGHLREWAPGIEWGHPFFGCDFAESLRRRDELMPAIRRWSPDWLVGPRSAPIYFENNWGLDRPDGVDVVEHRVHSPALGLGFRAIATARGATCLVRYPGHPTEGFGGAWDFVEATLKGPIRP